MSTPNISLTATLLDYSGNDIGTAAQPAYLRVALCGFGPVLPSIPGAGSLAKISSWFTDIPFVGTQITVKLWGNDQISPSGTFYAISVLDANKNVVQTGIYQFLGTQTIDLSNAPQIVQPVMPGGFNTVQEQLVGAVPGTVFTAPTAIWGTGIILTFYRGILQRLGTDYNYSNGTWTFTFSCNQAPWAVYVEPV